MKIPRYAWIGCLICFGVSQVIGQVIADVPTISKDELALVKASQNRRIAAIDKVRGTVVSIFGKTRQGGGSGVIFHPDGYVLTNFHVVQPCGESGYGGLADGKLYQWKLIGLDPGGDLAIIKLKRKSPDQPFPYAKLGSTENVHVGDWVMAMGNPFVLNDDLKPTVTLGIVSGVKRYQPGAGPNKTLLVYGNCLQIDSSINPGNSGGPLFDMNGFVLGINGRGSFEERGRVNVGLGYAISVEQIRYLIPELLATKVVQHGTLNATFIDRGGKVICNQFLRDSEINKLGLSLRDELISFNGEKIQYANQLTNHLAMLPAGWPVEVVFRSNGKVRTVHLRLSALDYGPMKKPSRVPMPTPKKPKPGEKPQKGKQQLIQKSQLKQTKPGAIRDAKENRQQAERLFKQWQQTLASEEALKKVKSIRYDMQITGLSGNQIKTHVDLWIDGRFKIEQVSDSQVNKSQWDGKTLTTQKGDQTRQITGDQALKNPQVAQMGIVAALYRPDGAKHFKTFKLAGVDKAQGQIAARIAATDHNGNRFLFWFGLYDEQLDFNVSLLKLAQITDDNPIDKHASIIAPPQTVGTIKMALPTRIVSGIEETPLADIKISKFESFTFITQWPNGAALIGVAAPTKETQTDTPQKDNTSETTNDKGGE